MLTACTAGAAGLHLDVLRTDLDLAVVIQLRHDLQRSEAGLASGVGIEGRNTHQTVNTVLTLQIAVGILPLDEDGGGLDARLIAGLVVHELIGVAVALRPAGIHPVEHLRPVLGLGAACSGVEGEDSIVGIVLAGQKRRQTALVDLLFQRLIAGGHLRQLGGVVLLLCHFAQGQCVLPVGHQTVVLPDLALQPLDLLGDLLAALHVTPKALLLRLLLKLRQLLTGLGNGQSLLQLLKGRFQRLKLLFIFVVFNDCHRVVSFLCQISLAFLLYPKEVGL